MTKEDKELLLKDLSARLAYGVKGLALGGKDDRISAFVPGEYPWVRTATGLVCHLDNGQFKPYLRPMSSMTDEEANQYYKIRTGEDRKKPIGELDAELFDFYHKNHIDYRGLIKKGLALEAPDGMYSVKLSDEQCETALKMLDEPLD